MSERNKLLFPGAGQGQSGPCLYCRKSATRHRRQPHYICPDCLDAMREDHEHGQRKERLQEK